MGDTLADNRILTKKIQASFKQQKSSGMFINLDKMLSKTGGGDEDLRDKEGKYVQI